MKNKVTMMYTLLGIIILGALIYYFKSHKADLNNESLEKVDPDNNPYADLRNIAFNSSAEFLEIQLPQDSIKIYGVITEWDIGNGTVSLVAFLSGDASLYFSSGGGVIGGFAPNEIKKAAIVFIGKAENHLKNTLKIETTPLPESNEVIFYFLTNKGKYAGKDKMENIESRTSEWTDLFDEANKLITAIRLTTDDEL